MEDIIKKGTLDKVLKSFGWIVLNAPKKTYRPPYPNLQEIFERQPVDVSRKAITVNG